MKWFIDFWGRHGDRLIFAALALILSGLLYQLEMKAEAKTIMVGIAMLFFNKTRGTNGQATTNVSGSNTQ